jgi:hypothetical protein
MSVCALLLPTDISMYAPIYQCMHRYINVCTDISMYAPIYQCMHRSIYPSIYRSIHRSIYLHPIHRYYTPPLPSTPNPNHPLTTHPSALPHIPQPSHPQTLTKQYPVAIHFAKQGHKSGSPPLPADCPPQQFRGRARAQRSGSRRCSCQGG